MQALPITLCVRPSRHRPVGGAYKTGYKPTPLALTESETAGGPAVR